MSVAKHCRASRAVIQRRVFDHMRAMLGLGGVKACLEGERMLRSLLAVSRSAVILGAVALVQMSAGAAADAHPDFSGVWTSYVEPRKPAFRDLRGRTEMPLTEAGKEKVAAYRKLIGTSGDNPGAHCLGSGMPESMM